MNGHDAYEHARLQALRDSDGALSEEQLVALVREAMDFDVDAEKDKKARRIVAARKRPGQTAPDGQLVLDGLDAYAYEPNRLIADDKGRLIENAKASPDFKAAEDRRAQADRDRANVRSARTHKEYLEFSLWALEQMRAGRPPDEITWENCIAERHLWKEGDAPADEIGDDE